MQNWNRMQVKPDAIVDMDILGLRRGAPRREVRGDEIILTVNDDKEVPMRYGNNDVVLHLKDTPTDQAANSTASRFAQYQRERPDDVAAMVVRLGVNASILEIVLALDAAFAVAPVTQASSQAYLRHLADTFQAKIQREDRLRRVAREIQAVAAVPLNKRHAPHVGRVCTG
jgi:hypothetical protein